MARVAMARHIAEGTETQRRNVHMISRIIQDPLGVSCIQLAVDNSHVVEMRSSGPWPETEINTTSGNEAKSITEYAVAKQTKDLACNRYLEVDA